MAPLIVLMVATLAFRLIGRLRVAALDSWPAAGAGVYAAQEGVLLRGQPATPLIPRALMQLLFIGLTWWSGFLAARRS